MEGSDLKVWDTADWRHEDGDSQAQRAPAPLYPEALTVAGSNGRRGIS